METYKNLLKEVGKVLKTSGWEKKADTFYLKNHGNWGVINFQKSKSNEFDKEKFTINLGIASSLLMEFNEENPHKQPLLENCHWRIRIGFILPHKADYWWEINESTHLKSLSAQIVEIILDSAVPKIEAMISDASLEHLWLSGVSDGLTDLQRLINLTTLLKAYNKTELEEVVDELKQVSKGKSYEFISKSHLKQLGIQY